MKQNPRSSCLAGDFSFSATEKSNESMAVELGEANQVLQNLALKGLESSHILFEAINHHLSAGGKRLRLMTGLEAGQRLGLGRTERQSLAIACELLHNASLVHDDIQDQDSQRRGAPSVWAKYGSDIALLVGDHLLSCAFGTLADVSGLSSQLISHFQARTRDLIIGQARDLTHESEEGLASPQALYCDIAASKSGTLLSLPMEMALLACGHTAHVNRAATAGRCFAIAYQIADDCQDLSDDAMTGRLNLIHLLTQSGESDALGCAVAIGLSECAHARMVLESLPKDIGASMLAQLLIIERALSAQVIQ
jgi:geranylgeranyl pyrophosphate synthase